MSRFRNVMEILNLQKGDKLYSIIKSLYSSFNWQKVMTKLGFAIKFELNSFKDLKYTITLIIEYLVNTEIVYPNES